MAIDTENKRRSVIGQAIVSLVVYETPDALSSSFDRRHRLGLYSGITTSVVPRFRWIVEQDSASTYRCEQDSASTYRCEQDSETTFASETGSVEG